MNTRRIFFRKLAAVAAALALAPELCFRAKLPLPEKEEVVAYWIQTTRWSRCTDGGYRKFREAVKEPELWLKLDAAFDRPAVSYTKTASGWVRS